MSNGGILFCSHFIRVHTNYWARNFVYLKYLQFSLQETLFHLQQIDKPRTDTRTRGPKLIRRLSQIEQVDLDQRKWEAAWK